MTETAHHPEAQSSEDFTYDLLERLPITGGGLVAVILLLILAVAGAIRLILLAMARPEHPTEWGYAAAVLAFLVSTAQAAPVLAFATRLAKGFWGIPLRRAADLLTVSGIVTTPLYILLLLQLPSFMGRTSIWNDWPGSPQVTDAVGIALLSLTGLSILWMTSLPDLAMVRDLKGRKLAGALSLGWTGTKRQWNVLSTGVILLGAFYLMWYAYQSMYLVSDMAMSLVPGWHSAIMPPYHAVSGLQAGLATVMLTLLALRKFAHLERYIGLDPFWGASKLMLGTSLLFFYFTWSEFNPTWYGRQPDEIDYLGSLMFGPFLPLMVFSFTFNFILPFVLLIWNVVRVSVKGPVMVAAIILIGNFVDRLRIYLASWTISAPVGTHIAVWPEIRPPGIGDIAIVVGAIAAVFCLYLLVLRIIPPISLWEYKQALLLRAERAYMKTEVAVVAKPR